MYALALAAAGTAALCWLLADTDWLSFLGFWLLYYVGLGTAHRMQWLHRPRWRAGALARFVQRLAGVHYAVDHLSAPAADRQYMFACEPHGALCLHMALGFAAHGDTLPPPLAERTFVVADIAARQLPLVRELLSAYGVVDALRPTLDRLLADGHSLAIVPSGMVGKEHALLDDPPPPGIVPIYRRRTRLGFLSLAARHRLLLVPVLSPDEPHAYHLLFRHWRAWPFVLVLGRALLAPLVPIRLYRGAPIDCSAYDHRDAASMAALADRYYAALAALAPIGTAVYYQ